MTPQALLRRVVYSTLRGPREAVEAICDRAMAGSLPHVLRNVVRSHEDLDPRMSRVHHGLAGIRRLHCAAGHKQGPGCVGTMTVDAVGVHLSCPRCGDLSHVDHPDEVVDALAAALEAAIEPGDKCEFCGGLGFALSGDACICVDGAGVSLLDVPPAAGPHWRAE